jgi:hypothetical protein
MHEAYQPVIDDGRGRFPEDLRVKAPRGAGAAIAAAAQLKNTSRSDCEAEADPSRGLRNRQPRGRSEVWSEGEALRLVKQATRMELHGLAAIVAVIWDTQFSPGDVRRLSEGQLKRDRKGSFFTTARAKTGKAAIGTVSRRTERLITEYRKTLKFDLLADAPLFRDQRGNAYSMFSLARDFRLVRDAVMSGDRRRLMDSALRSTGGKRWRGRTPSAGEQDG